MAVVVIVSAAGSPGVTTSAVGLALTWPRPVVLVEADPTGGSAVLAGYFRGAVAPAGSLLDLVWADREGRLADAWQPLLLRFPESTAVLLPGVRAHQQARSLTGLWSSLAGVLHELDAAGTDVLVDAGRLGLGGFPDALLAGADARLLVLRSDLVAVAAARSWAESLRGQFETSPASSPGLGVLLVGEGRPYGAREITGVLGLPVTAALAWDERAAAVFSRGATPPRRFDHGPLVRSLRGAAAAIQAHADAARAALNGHQTGSRP